MQGSSISDVEDIPAGDYSYLQVTDSGIGMTAETISPYI
jgi:HSP90 family molecular chaperone